MNGKILAFAVCVDAIYLLLYNFHDYAFKWRPFTQWIYTAQIILSGWFFVHFPGISNVKIHLTLDLQLFFF